MWIRTQDSDLVNLDNGNWIEHHFGEHANRVVFINQGRITVLVRGDENTCRVVMQSLQERLEALVII